jgi:two-component system, OmpR family, response regulator
VRHFAWLSAKDIPEAIDLRRCGWQLRACLGVDGPGGNDGPALADIRSIDAHRWIGLLRREGWYHRSNVLLVGVDHSGERARLLRLGFGDVLAGGAPLAEVEARAERIANRAGALPRYRNCGALQLDLLYREAFVTSRALGLHPREFELLWHLAEEPGRVHSRATLLANVWRLKHQPETNSIAVHICRLRAKLTISGCGDMVRTVADGYMLFASEDWSPPVVAWHSDDHAFASQVRDRLEQEG